jgi:hypothetical protein
MTQSHGDNEEIDNDRDDEIFPIQESKLPNLRLQSFVDRYGINEPEISPIARATQYVRKQCSSWSFECCINTFLDKIPLIRCLKEYKIRKNLFGDIISGITVAIMHIPQGKRKSSSRKMIL